MTPPRPPVRQTGQTFFRVGDKDFGHEWFYYVGDRPINGYSGDRAEVWERALQAARKFGADTIEEGSTERLNMYVGPGNFGPPRIDAVHRLAS